MPVNPLRSMPVNPLNNLTHKTNNNNILTTTIHYNQPNPDNKQHDQ